MIKIIQNAVTEPLRSSCEINAWTHEIKPMTSAIPVCTVFYQIVLRYKANWELVTSVGLRNIPIRHIFLRSWNIWYFIYLYSSPSTGILRTHDVTSSQMVW